MQPDFDTAIRRIRDTDKRYGVAAYRIVRDGLAYTAKKLGKIHAEGPDRHMNGRELALGIRDFALERYGCAAAYLLSSSGIRKSDDLGVIVFQLIDAGIFGKSDDDSPEDFREVFDFQKDMIESYRPSIRLRSESAPCAENA